MIRVVYVVDNLSFRGGERTFLQLVEGLDRGQYEPYVACSPGGVFVERLERLRIPVIPTDMRRRRLDTIFFLARLLRRIKPQIVHTQGRGDPFGRLAARLAGVPAIVSTTAMIAGRYRVDELWRKALYAAAEPERRSTCDPLGTAPALLDDRSESRQAAHRIAAPETQLNGGFGAQRRFGIEHSERQLSSNPAGRRGRYGISVWTRERTSPLATPR